jgi:hypothetical protein
MKRRDLLRMPIKRLKAILSDKEDVDPSIENEPAKPNLFSSSDLSIALSGDFNTKTLQYELMRMGVDPVNYSEQEMLDLVVAEMQKEKPSQG